MTFGVDVSSHAMPSFRPSALAALAAAACAMFLVSCGGGGGGGPAAPGAGTVAADPPVPLSLPRGLNPWFAGWTADAAGTETLLLTTLVNHTTLEPQAPLVAVAADRSTVTDATAALFAATPQFYWTRNIRPFTHPGTGTRALYFCNQGKEVAGGPPGAGDGRRYPNGYWGEQDRLFVMEGGRFVDHSEQLPHVVDFSHGCSVGSFGEQRLVFKNTLGRFDDAPPQQILGWDGTRFVDRFDASALTEPTQAFSTQAGRFSGGTVDDVLVGTRHLTRTPAGWQVLEDLRVPDAFAAAGFTLVHGGTVADFDGDGRPDVVLVFTHGVDLSVGVRLALYLNDGTGHLVLQPQGIRGLGDTDFSIEIRAFDVDLDGKPDLVVTGARAGPGDIADRQTRAVLINDGATGFDRRLIRDPDLDARCASPANWCHDQTWFSRRADGGYQLVVAEFDTAATAWKLHTRLVTTARPLTLTSR